MLNGTSPTQSWGVWLKEEAWGVHRHLALVCFINCWSPGPPTVSNKLLPLLSAYYWGWEELPLLFGCPGDRKGFVLGMLFCIWGNPSLRGIKF